MRKEIWKPVEGYENYEVSNLGRVKSLNYGKEKFLKPVKNTNGYLQVNLYRDRKIKRFLIHRLVATAFIPNPYGFKQVNHRDEVKANNFVFINEGGFVDLEKSNIEWCSAKYNSNFGTRNKRIASAQSKTVEASKYPDFRTIELRFASTNDAGRNGYDQGSVSACCNKCFHREGNNKYRNLYWRYAV